MLLIGAELLRIGKNLYIYITKSEPAQTLSEQLAEKT